MTSHRIKIVLALTALVITGFTFNLAAQDIPTDPDGNKERDSNTSWTRMAS